MPLNASPVVTEVSLQIAGTAMMAAIDSAAILPNSPVASFTPRKIYTQDDRTQQVYEARVRLAPGAARTMRAGAEGNVRIARPAPAPPAPGGRS